MLEETSKAAESFLFVPPERDKQKSLALCASAVKLFLSFCQLMGAAQGLRDPKPLAAGEDEPDACLEVEQMARGDKEGFDPVLGSEDGTDPFPFLPNQFKIPPP